MDKKTRIEIENKLNRAEDLMNEDPNHALSKLDGINPNADDLPENLKYYYYHLAGHIHYIRDDFDDAIICYNLALKNPDLEKEDKARIYKNLSSIYCEKDLNYDSISFSNKAIMLSKDNKTISGALHWMGISYRNQNDFINSISCFLRIIKLFREKRTDGWSKYMIESSYGILCFDYWKIQDEEKSEYYFHKLTSLKDVDPQQLKSGYLCKAHRLYEKRQWKDALEYYDKAIALMDNEEEKQHYQKYINDCKGWLAKESK